jgi:hypothetical protein
MESLPVQFYRLKIGRNADRNRYLISSVSFLPYKLQKLNMVITSGFGVKH